MFRCNYIGGLRLNKAIKILPATPDAVPILPGVTLTSLFVATVMVFSEDETSLNH